MAGDRQQPDRGGAWIVARELRVLDGGERDAERAVDDEPARFLGCRGIELDEERRRRDPAKQHAAEAGHDDLLGEHRCVVDD